jgi:hypothetical protein
MSLRQLTSALVFVAACAVQSGACSAQPPATGADTQKQIDALRAQVTAMQKDLDEVKTLLAQLRAKQAQSREAPLIDLGARPMKGAASARLTLVELTDYQ